MECCRICLKENIDTLIPIFSPESFLHIKIMSCAKILISENDHMPQFICKTCKENLETAFEFRKLCENSDNTLRMKLNNKNTQEILFKIHNSFIKDLEYSPLSKNINREKSLHIKDFNESYIINSKPEIIHPETIHQCETCGKTFKKNSQLAVHIRTHTGEKPFICETCGKTFRVHHHLLSHNRTHTSERPYQCLNCGKCFTDNSSLSRHNKTHTSEKKFSCSYCPKKFIRLNDLRNHTLKHSGERPFRCNICEKKYSDPSSLSKHRKLHQNVVISDLDTEMTSDFKISQTVTETDNKVTAAIAD